MKNENRKTISDNQWVINTIYGDNVKDSRIDLWLSVLKTVAHLCLLGITWGHVIADGIPMWNNPWFALGMILLFRIVEGSEKA